MNGLRGDLVNKVLSSARPEELDFPVPSTDHSDHMVYLTLKGHTKLAADHILHKEMVGRLEGVVGNVIRQLNFIFNKAIMEMRGEDTEEDRRRIISCARAYETLIQTAMNLIGLESRMVGFSKDETDRTLGMITRVLKGWERLEREGILGEESGDAPIARAVVEGFLSEMEAVMSEYYRPPGSMVSHVAKAIREGLDDGNIMGSFIKAAERLIKENIYYRLGEAGLCKFGNDYALGLRWLRHLGFVQVSTNPVLAAIAYDDEPTLWDGYKGESLCPDFKTAMKDHPELLENPEAHGDEIAAVGTEVSIWPNLAVFRPIAIASDMYHGMVSLQLNPKIADSFEDSLRDALRIYGDAQEFLKRYDRYLLWGYSESIERGRPNIVFKVSGSSPAAIDLTRKLESLGIGTNNTVTFTVSQEVRLILAKMEGRAEAVKKGIRLTTVYETNMGGRFDDHVREVQAEKLLSRVLDKIDKPEEKVRVVERLAEQLGALDEVRAKSSLEDKVRAVCSRRYLRPMTKEPFINLLAEMGVISGSRDEVQRYISTLEEDIGYCGIYITMRVYEIFFSPENRPKWISYLKLKYGLTDEEAEEVMRGIDVLPASKRKPIDTLLTLGDSNMTHTEFPNHQMNVYKRSLEPDFKIEEYRNSVLSKPDPERLRRLTEEWDDIRDIFIGGYELTPYLVERLKEAGIEDAERYGTRGITPPEWGELGATEKTMTQFSNSYDRFRERCVKYVKEMLKEEVDAAL